MGGTKAQNLMLQDLIHHNGYANASLLKAIRQHETAAQDPELWKLLHHILLPTVSGCD